MAVGKAFTDKNALPLHRWLYAPGIARKLVLINLLPFALVVALTVVLVFTVNILSGLRAYVAGEGLYSKYQKDAVFYLQRYIETGDESHYLRYFRDIGVPLGDGMARQELEKTSPDRDKATAYFLQGQNAAPDVPYLIDLFIRFRRAPFVERAVQIWSDADVLVEQLVEVAATAHRQIANGQMTPEDKQRTLGRIADLNDQLIDLENDFSRTLGEGFDLTSSLLLFAMIAIAGLVLVIGFLFSRTVGRSIEREIGDLAQSVGRLTAGDFSARSDIHSDDELGELAKRFNAMAANIENAHRELELSRDVALQSSQVKSSFLGSISHEIQTPLHVMLGHADVLNERFGNDRGSDLWGHVHAIQSAGEVLLAKVQGIVDFSKIEAGAFELHPAPINPGALLRREVQSLETISRQKGVKLECRIEEASRTIIIFDAYCLSGALANLLSDAIAFAERGTVIARLFRNDGALRIEVRNTGTGNGPFHIPQSFDGFSHRDGDQSHRFEAAGLGLALARSYLLLNRATLSAESVPGEGSLFTIEFSRDCEFSPSVEETQRPALTLVAKKPESSVSTPLALVFDGDSSSQALIKTLLSRRYGVLTAESIGEARSIIETHAAALDLIVMDVSRNGSAEGLMLARQLREDARFDKISVIATIADATADDRESAFAAGCNECMAKPVNPARLFATLERLENRGTG